MKSLAKDKLRVRRHALKYKYGLTLEELERLLAQQKGGCAICRCPITAMGKRGDPHALGVDHCHTNGTVRGLLCGPCNRGIGMFRDDPDLLRRAARYLTK